MSAMHETNKMCFMLTRPMNNNNIAVAPVSNAFDKLAGIINAQVITIGIMTGKKPFLKSFITSCLRLNCRERYMNNASLAKSLV